MNQTALLLLMVSCVALRSSFGNTYGHCRSDLLGCEVRFFEEPQICRNVLNTYIVALLRNALKQ
jgi:hypothetical protein